MALKNRQTQEEPNVSDKPWGMTWLLSVMARAGSAKAESRIKACERAALRPSAVAAMGQKPASPHFPAPFASSSRIIPSEITRFNASSGGMASGFRVARSR